jgi:oligopeptide/dipeptide ABC transporter ATP-binding protein
VAKTDFIFDNCQHPYTKALMSAIPIPEVTGKRERTILQGEVPNPLNPPTGCRFHPRCPLVMDICRKQEPELRDIASDHMVACHLTSR